MSRQNNPLPGLVESFFREHLQRVRGASAHTVRAYRDTLRLLLLYLTDQKGCAIGDLQVNDLQMETVSAFLIHLESQRANSVATRNCRLAALRAFFKHLMRHDPTRAEQYYRVLSLPTKKAKPATASYLEPEQVRLILNQPDRRTVAGKRHYVLLLFLYNTGARVSEALAVRVADLDLAHPAQVRLRGKGGRDRFCPLWRETATLLQRLPVVCEGRSGELLFRNQRGEPLTRDGVAYILGKYATLAARDAPALHRRKITPHVLRHYLASRTM